ncbi:MAG: hypothetical protein QM658_07670 [Gordonia sp. (in: high G+C Gram-positive bacteria)]
MVRSSPGTSYARASVLDRMHAGARSTGVIGPIALPTAEVAAQRLRVFAELGPASRIALRPDPSASRWGHHPDDLLAAVRTLPAPTAPEDLFAHADATVPLRLSIAGDYLLTEHDHGLGDVQLALVAALMAAGGLDGRDQELLRSVDPRRAGLITAVARTYGTRPSRAIATLQQIRVRSTDASSTSSAATMTRRDVQGDPMRTRTAFVERDQLAALRASRRSGGPSAKTLMMCGLVRAFREAGVDLDDRISIPVDLRRYLAASKNPLANMVAAVEFAYLPDEDPAVLHERVAQAVAAGRPVAAAVRSSLAGRRALAAGPAVDESPAEPPRPAILISGVHDLPLFHRFDWLSDDQRTLMMRAAPYGGTGLTVITAELSGRLTLTTTFDSGWHDPNVISAALHAFAADPIAYTGRS